MSIPLSSLLSLDTSTSSSSLFSSSSSESSSSSSSNTPNVSHIPSTHQLVQHVHSPLPSTSILGQPTRPILSPACDSCRLKKIACTREKPVCGHCQAKSLTCVYPLFSARRGKDRNPCGRIKKRLNATLDVNVKAGKSEKMRARSVKDIDDEKLQAHEDVNSDHLREAAKAIPLVQTSLAPLVTTTRQPFPPRRINLQDDKDERATVLPLYSSPGDIPAAAESYWTWILEKNGPDRRQSSAEVVRLVTSFFTNSHVWTNFLHRGLLFRAFLTASGGLRGNPHIVMAILAHVTLVRAGDNPAGQIQACRYAEEADSLVTYYQTAGSMDPSTLAATLILTMFEFQPHLNHSLSRLSLSLLRLNSIGLSLFTNRLDTHEPHVSTNVFGLPEATASNAHPVQQTAIDPHIDQWVTTPLWSPNWGEGEIRKEEMRRMCWTAISMAAHYSLWRYMRGMPLRGLDMHHPERFRLFFPGEAVFQEWGQIEQGKTTPWALYHRMVNLWLFVDNRRQDDQPLDPGERATVFAKLDKVERSVEQLSRGNLTNYLWQAGDWAMVIRRSLGGFDDYHVRKWFKSRLEVMYQFANPPNGKPKIKERMLYCWWYVMQAHSALELAGIDSAYWEEADAVYEQSVAALRELKEFWNTYPLQLFHDTLVFRYMTHMEERLSTESGNREKLSPSDATLKGSIRLTEKAIPASVLAASTEVYSTAAENSG